MRLSVKILVVMVVGLLCGCGGEAKPVISKQEYSVAYADTITQVLMVKGTVKNAGSKDAKKIVITADCNCPGTSGLGWTKLVKGTVIDYLGAGDKETFEFGVALRMSTHFYDEAPPDKLEAKVVSFETVK